MVGHLNRARRAPKIPDTTLLRVWLLTFVSLAAAVGLMVWFIVTQIPRTDIMTVCKVTPLDRMGVRAERYVVRTDQGEYSLREVSFDGITLGKDQAAAQLRPGTVYEIDHTNPFFLLTTPPRLHAISSLPNGTKSEGRGC